MPPSRNFFDLFFLTTVAAIVVAATPSNGTFDGCQYQVEGVGAFSSHFAFDFTTMDTLPDELIASTYQVGPGPYAPYAHIFNPSNIVLRSGQPMQMIVPGGQTTDPLETCQLVTRYDDVLYASVRTIAQASPVNGTVHGFFMYMNDTQETDIEIRTGDPNHIHFTNQQTRPGNGETTYAVSAPDTMASAFHEYRYDWLPTGTNFYIDGVLTMSINRNVPSAAGWLMWNSWSNGWAWTFGPPAQDNILQIRSVEAYFNRTSVDTSNCTASSGSSAATGVVVTSGGARITTNAAAIGNPPSSTSSSTTASSSASTIASASSSASSSASPSASASKPASSSASTSASILTSTSASSPASQSETGIAAPSQTDDGTFNIATRMFLSARLSTGDTEKFEHIFDNTYTNNTLQAMITIGIVSDSTNTLLLGMKPVATAAAHARPSVQQLLRTYKIARLVVVDCI